MRTRGTTSPEFPDWYIKFQQAALAALPRPPLIDKDTALGLADNGASMKAKFADALLPPKPVAPIAPEDSILEMVAGVIALSKCKGRFRAGLKFTKENAEVSFYDFGSNFKAWFLPKEEGPQAARCLRTHILEQNARDGEIIKALGGEDKCEITLTELYALLKRQARGQQGRLSLTTWNVCYIRDASNILRAVSVSWYGGGWCVGAYALGDSLWRAGNQILSPAA